MSDYLYTHPQIDSARPRTSTPAINDGLRADVEIGPIRCDDAKAIVFTCIMHDRLLLFHGNIRGLAVDSRAKLRVMALKQLVVY